MNDFHDRKPQAVFAVLVLALFKILYGDHFVHNIFWVFHQVLALLDGEAATHSDRVTPCA